MVHQRKGRGKGGKKAAATLARSAAPAAPKRGEWLLFAHPCFVAQVEKLISAVEQEKKKNAGTWQSSNNAKLLAVICDLVLEKIPADPSNPAFRQGDTLGADRKHWFRAKFGGGRFRLFYRFSSAHKTIIYAWVNDSETLRTYGSKTDAYAVFKSMLDKGNPPNGWDALLVASSTPQALAAMKAMAALVSTGTGPLPVRNDIG